MKNLYFIALAFLLWKCQKTTDSSEYAEEQIVQTLKKETQYFCERKLADWQKQWSHQAFVSKMYIGDGKFVEFNGWEEIKQNTLDHLREFPDPIPVPETTQDYSIELFDRTAFVFYAKKGEEGMVRETRFMVKEEGKWKIARMQTIY